MGGSCCKRSGGFLSIDQLSSVPTQSHLLDAPVTDKDFEIRVVDDDRPNFIVASMQGWRQSMEDAHRVILEVDGNPECSAFGIFDGHSGTTASIFAAEHLLDRVIGHALFGTGRTDNTVAAIKDSFVNTDAEFIAAHGARDTSGTTAVIAIVDGSVGKIFVGNAGDSRCVLCRGDKAIPLSADHKPAQLKEKARIRAAGGVVLNNRVNGVLSTSRAIGDVDLKGNPNIPLEDQAVTAMPDVFHIAIKGEDKFLILACDGLWDVMSSHTAVTFVRERLEKEGDDLTERELRFIATDLLDHCLGTERGGLGTDNISVIIVLLTHLASQVPSSATQRQSTKTTSSNSSGCEKSTGAVGTQATSYSANFSTQASLEGTMDMEAILRKRLETSHSAIGYVSRTESGMEAASTSSSLEEVVSSSLSSCSS